MLDRESPDTRPRRYRGPSVGGHKEIERGRQTVQGDKRSILEQQSWRKVLAGDRTLSDEDHGLSGSSANNA